MDVVQARLQACPCARAQLGLDVEQTVQVGESSGIFAFGEFELDGSRFELRRCGTPIAAQPKVLRLLFLLVEQRARALPEAELLSRLWPNERVSRASVKRAVMGARIALGDRSQACIRTVRGHGYQFTLPVRIVAASAPPTAEAHSTVAPDGISSGSNSAHAPRLSLVGRGGVMALLTQAVALAQHGEGQLVLLYGEPGLGKTRVLHALAEHAAAHGAQAYWGLCLELEGAPAYWPLQQIVRAALEGRGALEVLRLLGPSADDLAEAFPELLAERRAMPEDPPQIGMRQARFRLFDGLAQFLVRLSVERPLVLLIDDLQRADQATLRFLRFLASQLATSRILVIGTARPADESNPGAEERLAELARESSVRSVALGGFSSEDIARYLELATGKTAPAHVVLRLSEQTGGNPLFLEEILRGMPSAQDSNEPNGLWERLSQVELGIGLRGAIARHLAVLAEPCRETVAAASVLGLELTAATLGELLCVSAQSVQGLLQQAVHAGVLRASSAAAGGHRFAHVLIRDALYETLEPRARAELHARAGQNLEQSGEVLTDDAFARMAEHFRLSLPETFGDKALAYTEEAGKRALARLAYEEAAVHFGHALGLIDTSLARVPQRMSLLLAQGEALLFAGDPCRARLALLSAVDSARRLGDTTVLAKAARLLGRERESGAVDEPRVALLREALAALSVDDERAPCLTAMLAKALSYSGDHAARVALAHSALANVHRASDPLHRAETLAACHEALTDPDSCNERAHIATELARLAQLRSDPRIVLAALCARFQSCLDRGAVHGMQDAVSSLATLAQTSRDPHVRWHERIYRATCALVAGRYVQAEELAREAWTLGQRVGEDIAYHVYCVQVNGMFCMQGRYAEAETMAREASLRFHTLGWRAWHACIASDLGRSALARDTLTELLAQGLTVFLHDPYPLSALCPLAELAARVGTAQQLRAVFDVLEPYADLNGSVSFGAATYGPLSLHLARLSLKLGHGQAARAYGEAALSAAERMESPPFVALGCLTLAVAHLSAKSSQGTALAMGLVARARELAEAGGMKALLPACTSLANAAGHGAG
jgi:DNA-binding winged helix-turn-helix (wHTH) protein